LPRRHSSADRGAAYRDLQGHIRARRGIWVNRLTFSGDDVFRYIAPTAHGEAAPAPPQEPKAGPAEDAAPQIPDDVRALSALIVYDLQDLALAWRATGIGTAPTTKSASPPWAVLARGGKLSPLEHPSSPGGPSPDLYSLRSRQEVPLLPRGTEGRRMADGFRTAAESLAGVLRGPECSPEAALRVGRILVRADAAADMSVSPLQRATVYLGALGKLVAVAARSEAPELGQTSDLSQMDSRERKLEEDEDAAQSVLDQMALRSRFLLDAHRAAAGLTSGGGSHGGDPP